MCAIKFLWSMHGNSKGVGWASHVYIYIYIYIYRERERERDRGAAACSDGPSFGAQATDSIAVKRVDVAYRPKPFCPDRPTFFTIQTLRPKTLRYKHGLLYKNACGAYTDASVLGSKIENVRVRFGSKRLDRYTCLKRCFI